MKKFLPRSIFFGRTNFFSRAICLLLSLFILSSCGAFINTISEPKRLKEIPVGIKVDDPLFFLFLAKNFYLRKEYRRAIHFYEKAKEQMIKSDLQESRDYQWVIYEIGFCFYKMKNYRQAIENFREVTKGEANFAARKLATEMIERISQKRG